MFPNVINDDANEQELDNLFNKGRVILYQQDYSERAESIAIQATFSETLFLFLYCDNLLLDCLFDRDKLKNQ